MFAVRASSESELSDYGVISYETELTAPPEIVTSLIGTPGDEQINVQWGGSALATSYDLYMYQGDSAPSDPDDWVFVDGKIPDAHLLVTDLTNGLPYVFGLDARNRGGVSERKVSEPIIPRIPQPPTSVAAFTGTPGDGQIELEWEQSELANYYNLYMYQGSSAPSDSEEWNFILAEIKGTSHVVEELTNGLPYVFGLEAVNQHGTSDRTVSEALTPQSGTPGPGPDTDPDTDPDPEPEPETPSPNKPDDRAHTVKVDVASGSAGGAVVSSLSISRSTGADGKIRDQLSLGSGKALEIIAQVKEKGANAATILLPDANDAISEWELLIGRSSAALLVDEEVDLVIENRNVTITIPSASLKGRTSDIYFRLVPLKSEDERTDTATRAKMNAAVVEQAGGEAITVVGRPMTIETNLQQQPVTLVLPLDDAAWNGDSDRLGVYIEHSDGTQELVAGEVVTREDGTYGLRIVVDRFSTFTVVDVAAWGAAPTPADDSEDDETLATRPYINGYPDGTFGPARQISRAEAAAMIARLYGGGEASGHAAFGDVAAAHWAAAAIAWADDKQLMLGYPDGSFRPNRAITRAELASLLVRAAGHALPHAEDGEPFTDMDGHWAAANVAQLSAAGIIGGYVDGSFRPDEAVTRAEAVAMVNRLLGLAGDAESAPLYADVPARHWAFAAIQAASIRP
ncbi:S-layer homology domain-containing protein [Paenibacillus sp. IB182496]|uniref:S-layer homology domain-containing protein n=1 Tax=Paenibacillus sabuli TaxID=2772509 RepID=A0A927GPP9_9BACL|nr:S-layer homology domain-containing protein [Paenibacillus sabuli]MBD2843704.1 S-layer homology domain-containing protein [Paenibacillus sabuli]